MALLVPVKCGNLGYPYPIEPKILEISAHFDSKLRLSKERIKGCSLHTEYTGTTRGFSSEALRGLEIIKASNRGGVPLLWYDGRWCEEFCIFVDRWIEFLEQRGKNVVVLEIHPPFKYYCPNTEAFLKIYSKFEEYVLSNRKLVIALENRSPAKNLEFLISTERDIEALCNDIEELGLKLKLMLDIPQMLSACGILKPKCQDEGTIINVLRRLTEYREYIAGIHIWGRKKAGNRNAHNGDLDDYFEFCPHLKENFLSELFKLLNDGATRYFYPEIFWKNSMKDRDSMVRNVVEDLQKAGFRFV